MRPKIRHCHGRLELLYLSFFSSDFKAARPNGGLRPSERQESQWISCFYSNTTKKPGQMSERGYLRILAALFSENDGIMAAMTVRHMHFKGTTFVIAKFVAEINATIIATNLPGNTWS
jgi:hypothetical protein